MTTNIDIELPVHLTGNLELKACAELSLPKPGKLELKLPLGGTLKGLVDVTKGIPDDCSLGFSLILQLMPVLAATECVVKVLKLIAPLIDVVKGLGPPPDLIKLGQAIPKFIQAATDLMPCILNITVPPLAIFPFLKDLLCLIIKLVGCLIEQLTSIRDVMGGISLQIQLATTEGNTQLLAQLECAQENAALSAAHVMSGFEPIMVVLDLAKPFFELAGLPGIAVPAIASPADLSAMDATIDALKGVQQALELAAQPVGGC